MQAEAVAKTRVEESELGGIDREMDERHGMRWTSTTSSCMDVDI